MKKPKSLLHHLKFKGGYSVEFYKIGDGMRTVWKPQRPPDLSYTEWLNFKIARGYAWSKKDFV